MNWKGHKYAIEAVKILKTKYPNLVLHFYGIGAYEDELKSMIKSNHLSFNVKLQGFTRNINEKYTEYDIVLIPSIMEPFGMVFLEAFNHNKPVVAFDLPAGNEIIRHGYNGRLAKPYSSESLAEEIDFLIQHPKQREEIIFNAKKELQEKYSIQKMAASYISFYQKILSN